MVSVCDGGADATAAGVRADEARARDQVRADALAECLAIARAAVAEFGPLTAAGARAVAQRIERLMEA